MAAIHYVESRQAIQYTGSNSAELEAEIADFTITSESGGSLSFDSNSAPYTIATGDWVFFWQGYVNFTQTSSAFPFYYVENALKQDLDEITDIVSDLGGAAVRSVGIASAPTLLLNTPAVVAVTLNPAMPDASYSATAHVFGGVNLSSVTINSVTVVDVDTVNVSVQTSLVSLAGLHVAVVARD